MPPSPDWLPLAKFAVQLGTLIGAVGVAAAALWQAGTARKRHNEQTRADRERRIIESFAKAVEQLGSEKLETRLGGIYTLERISREKDHENDSEAEYYWPIMETLTAFVREHAPWPPRQAPSNQLQVGGGDEAAGESAPTEQPESATEQASVQVRPATDIQAVLTVLGRRDEKTALKQDETVGPINLMSTDLRGGNLFGAHLEYARLAEAHLQGASLASAHLKRADLDGADLQGASLDGADLQGASLIGADLRGASLLIANLEYALLRRAHLEGADLMGARLEGANLGGVVVSMERLLESADLRGAPQFSLLEGAHLEGADLRDAFGLTQEQLDLTIGDDRTLVPEGLTRPAHWSKARPATAQPPDATIIRDYASAGKGSGSSGQVSTAQFAQSPPEDL